MKGIKFKTMNSKKDYVVIERHGAFKDTWRCYPAEKNPPYIQTLIDCFSTDFIEDCLKQENIINENKN